MKDPKLPDDIYTASNNPPDPEDGCEAGSVNIPQDDGPRGAVHGPYDVGDDPGTAIHQPDYVTPSGQTEVKYDTTPRKGRPVSDYKNAQMGVWKNEHKPNKGDSPRSNSSKEFKDNYNNIDWNKNGDHSEKINVQKTPLRSRRHPGRMLVIYK
jgi:hypothetical protein